MPEHLKDVIGLSGIVALWGGSMLAIAHIRHEPLRAVAKRHIGRLFTMFGGAAVTIIFIHFS